MRKVLLVALVLAGITGACFLSVVSQPDVRAIVDVTDDTLVIVNRNDQPWTNAQILLNSAFDGPIVDVPGTWAPQEKKELHLAGFRGRLNQQSFDPEVDRVRQVFVNVDGFKIGTYRTRTASR